MGVVGAAWWRAGGAVPAPRRSAPVGARPTLAGEVDAAISQPVPLLRMHRTSPFQEVFVVDRGDQRSLHFAAADSRLTQSMVIVSRPDEVALEYVRLALAGVLLAPPVRRALLVGLGGGTWARALARLAPGVHVEAVEIDPVVVEVAREWFFLPADADWLTVFVADGGAHLRRTTQRYELIFLDGYGAESVPEALSTVAFFEAVRSRLAPGGVVIANLTEHGAHAVVEERFRQVFRSTSCAIAWQSHNRVLYGAAGDLPAGELHERAAAHPAPPSPLGVSFPQLASHIHRECPVRQRWSPRPD